MKIIDISIPVSSDMPVWPGDSGVNISRVRQIDKGEGANVSHLSIGVHTGTHVDAPLHFISAGDSLEKIPLDNFIGDVEIVEIMDVSLITAADIKNTIPDIQTRRILFKTRNSSIWENADNKFHEDFVALSPDAAQFLVDHGISLVGIDYLSIAPYRESRPTHEILLAAGVVILEGINLAGVTKGSYTLFCLPLKLVGVDGAPARAILVSD